MPSRGNGWQTPFSTRVAGHTLDVRRALDSPVHRLDRATRKRLRVSSVRNAQETWPLQGSDGVGLLQRPSHRSSSEKSPRSWYGETRHPGLGDWRRVGAPGPSTEPISLDKAGATQERCRSCEHGQPRRRRLRSRGARAERDRRPVPLRPASHARGVHLSDHNADRGEPNSGFRGQGVVWRRHSGELASR
jgi:hypothetical protein